MHSPSLPLQKSLPRLRAHSLPHKPHKSPSEEADEDEEDLELPVNPDQGTPLTPDEEGHVEVPA